MQPTDVRYCLALLEAAEHAPVEAGDIAATGHVSMAIDRFRATHRMPERPVDPAVFGAIAGEF